MCGGNTDAGKTQMDSTSLNCTGTISSSTSYTTVTLVYYNPSLLNKEQQELINT